MRRKLPARVIGLYPDRDKWRLLICEHGKKKSIILPNKEEAERIAKEIGAQYNRPEGRRTEDVILEWVAHRLHVAAAQPETIRSFAAQLRVLLRGDVEQDIQALTPKRAEALYQLAVETPTQKTGRPLSAASHRLYLWIAKSFFSWVVQRGYVGINPFAKIEAVGKVNIGKRQLRLDEARQFLDTAFRYYAEKKHPLAIGAAVALMMGMRTGEILERQVRDLEDGARYLCIDRGKTHNAARRPEVPERLRSFLLALAHGRRSDEYLFGQSRRGKPRRRQLLYAMVKRLCKLAGIPLVCTHSLRGLFATLGVQSGAVTHAVAATLGHGSFAITQRHYAQADAVTNAQTSRVADMLGGNQPSTSLSELSAEQLMARLDPATLAHLAALVAAKGRRKK